MRAMISIVCFILACILFSACNSGQPHYVVGVSQCWDDAWRQKMNGEMDCEVLLHPEITLKRRTSYGSNVMQCAQIDSFIREQVDVLIVSPNEPEEIKPAISRAFKSGIPVIIADRRISGDEWSAFIGGDNYHVGLLMAQWVKEVSAQLSATEGGRSVVKVLEVQGLPGSTPEMLRHQGFVDGLGSTDSAEPRPYIEVRSIPGHIDAYTEVSNYLRMHKDVDAIVAQNDLMAVEAAKAVNNSRGYGKGSVRIMGVDGVSVGLQAIVNGDIECTAIYPTRGDLIIRTAEQILEGEPYERDTVLETMMIDASSAFLILRQYELHMHDLETMRLVSLQTDSKWQDLNTSKIIMISAIVLISLLFLLALSFVILMQRKMQTKIKHDILPQLVDMQEAIQLSHRDVAFAERIKQLVDDHITNPDLNVEFLAGKLQLDRTQVFRRVKTATGKGPMEFIRERRLLRADELLRTTDMTIRQVALELGFSSPGYFSKYYRDYFGHLPSDRS